MNAAGNLEVDSDERTYDRVTEYPYLPAMAGGTFLERADYVGGHKGKSE